MKLFSSYTSFVIYLYISIIILSVCCTSTPSPTSIVGIDTSNTLIPPGSNDTPRTYTYQGCEYIMWGYGSGVVGTHKGNCKNPIHSRWQPTAIEHMILDEDKGIVMIQWDSLHWSNYSVYHYVDMVDNRVYSKDLLK